MYYAGHYRWYAQNGGTGGNPSDSRAGTGIGVKVAVNDSGISNSALSAFMGSTTGYDYVTSTSGVSADGYGHGSHVAGIIAAPKDDVEMQGIAYNATLVPFRVFNNAGTSVMTDSIQADMISRALAAGAYINNNSWGSQGVQITAYTAAQLQAAYPLFITQLQNYVTNGGVVVFAAGNDSLSNPSPQAGLPYRISGIQSGWLAVVATDSSGTIAAYSNKCGVAAAWCLAAPGSSIYSTYKNDTYATLNGTSMAAPLVSGAIASLKSMFPSLSYQDIAARLLTTATKTGIWATSSTYGQGLMNLSAASNPVGGLSLPTAMGTSGSIAGLNSKISLPADTVASARGAQVLLVDNYQRAPFYVPASNFIQESKIQSNFAGRHLNSLSSALPLERLADENLGYSYTQGLNSAMSLSYKGDRFAFSNGLRSEQPLSRQLGISYIPHLNNSATNTNGFGYSTSFGNTKFAMLGSMPNTQGNLLSDSLEDKSQMGSRNAISMIAQRDHGPYNFGATISSANNFSQPLGLTSSGAFGFRNSQASSAGSFFNQSIFNGTTWLKTAVEIASLNANSSGLTTFQNGKYSIFKFGVDHYLDKYTALSFGLKQEQAISGQLVTKLPSTVDESGNIGYQSYATSFGSLLNSRQANLDIHHRIDSTKRIKMGLMYEARPYGMNAAGVAAFFEQRL
jgi:hypothetical protein